MKTKLLGLAVMLATLLPAQQAAAAPITVQCEVVEVATLGNRVHIRCLLGPTFSTLWYYAVPTSSPVEAQSLLTMGTAAMLAGTTKSSM
jgi:hypothetical protein